MNKTAQNQYNSLMEAYYAVYDDDIRNKLNEEKEIKEFLEIIDFLIEDGYDLSEYTYVRVVLCFSCILIGLEIDMT